MSFKLKPLRILSQWPPLLAVPRAAAVSDGRDLSLRTLAGRRRDRLTQTPPLSRSGGLVLAPLVTGRTFFCAGTSRADKSAE
jgi:hypothetical protein